MWEFFVCFGLLFIGVFQGVEWIFCLLGLDFFRWFGFFYLESWKADL